MGGFTASRNHLFNLFPYAFKRSIEEETEVCLVVVDLMQFLAGKVKFQGDGLSSINVEGITSSICHTVESYMPEYNKEYRATRAMVALFDTPKNVPTNKAATQQKRDQAGLKILNEELYRHHYDATLLPATGLGDLLNWSLDGETIWRSNNTRSQLYALITEQLLKIQVVGECTLVIDDGIDIDHTLYLERREQMLRDHYFQDRSPYEQECLVANLARLHFTERFVLSEAFDEQGEPTTQVKRLPQTLMGEADIKIPGFVTYTREVNTPHSYMIVSQDTDLIFILLLHLKTLLSSSKQDEDPHLQVWLDTQTPVDRKNGLSRPYRYIDVKALYYAIITLFAKEYPSIKNPIETLIFLVYCLETDFTGGFDKYLTVTPRSVWNTFSALHTPLEVTKEKGYIVFNDTMYDETAFVATGKKTKESESAKMGTKRSIERYFAYPSHWHSLLSDGVVALYNRDTDHYDITLNDVPCQTFLYLLCQFKVLDDLAGLGYTQFSKKPAKGGALLHQQRTYIPNGDELFIWISTIEGQLEQHRHNCVNEEGEKKRKMVDIAAFTTSTMPKNKKPKLLQKYPPRSIEAVGSVKAKTYPLDLNHLQAYLSRPKSDAMQLLDEIEEFPVEPIIIDKNKEDVDEHQDDIEEEEPQEQQLQPLRIIATPTTSTTVRKKLSEMCKKEMPKQYGIPSLQAMLARIARVTWIMNYHQNGWKSPSYATNFAETHPDDATLSRYGWKAEEIIQNDENLRNGAWNNSYYTSVFEEGVEPGMIPVRVYRMVETDQVYNKSHDTYRNSFAI